MARDKGRLSLKADIEEGVWSADPGTFHQDDVTRVTVAVLAAVLPHFELAYQRGLMAAKSQAGYATRRKPKEEA